MKNYGYIKYENKSINALKVKKYKKKKTKNKIKNINLNSPPKKKDYYKKQKRKDINKQSKINSNLELIDNISRNNANPSDRDIVSQINLL